MIRFRDLVMTDKYCKISKHHHPQGNPSDYNIMVFGCSNAKGKGLERSQVFDYILKREIEKHHDLEVTSWNLSLNGKGPDYSKLMFNYWGQRLKPNLVIFWWPNFNRSLFFDKLKDEFVEVKALNDYQNELVKSHFAYFSTDEQEIYHWYYNCYLFVENLCKILNIKSIHFSPDLNGMINMKKKYGLNSLDYFGDNIVNVSQVGRPVDKVSENDSHRGPKTHDNIGKGLYKMLKERKYFEKL